MLLDSISGLISEIGFPDRSLGLGFGFDFRGFGFEFGFLVSGIENREFLGEMRFADGSCSEFWNTGLCLEFDLLEFLFLKFLYFNF